MSIRSMRSSSENSHDITFTQETTLMVVLYTMLHILVDCSLSCCTANHVADLMQIVPSFLQACTQQMSIWRGCLYLQTPFGVQRVEADGILLQHNTQKTKSGILDAIAMRNKDTGQQEQVWQVSKGCIPAVGSICWTVFTAGRGCLVKV